MEENILNIIFEMIKSTPNDSDLGEKIRKLYWYYNEKTNEND